MKSGVVQLFQNLVGNAIKYRGEKLPVIRVTAGVDGETGFLRGRQRDRDQA